MLEDALLPIGFNKLVFITSKAGYNQVWLSSDMGEVWFYNVRTRDHYFQPVTGQHGPFMAGDVDALRDSGFKVFLSIRHPVDAFFSFLRKRKEISIASMPQHARAYISKMKSFYRHRDACAVFRYEDLLDDPVHTIQTLAHGMGRSITASTAREIWDEYGLKQLPHAPVGHYQGGKRNVWCSELSERERAILSQEKIDGLIDLLGYPHVPDAVPLAETGNRQHKPPKQEHVPDPNNIDMEAHAVTKHGVLFYGQDKCKKLIPPVVAALNDPLILSALNAASLEECPDKPSVLVFDTDI